MKCVGLGLFASIFLELQLDLFKYSSTFAHLFLPTHLIYLEQGPYSITLTTFTTSAKAGVSSFVCSSFFSVLSFMK